MSRLTDSLILIKLYLIFFFRSYIDKNRLNKRGKYLMGWIEKKINYFPLNYFKQCWLIIQSVINTSN